jgi:methionyl-tRNA synthetase
MTTNNAILLNNIGNFVHRGLSFVTSTFEGVMPEMSLTGIEVVKDNGHVIFEIEELQCSA